MSAVRTFPCDQVNLSSNLQLHEAGFEFVLHRALMAQALSRGERGLPVCRAERIAVAADAKALLERVSILSQWSAHRPDETTAILRAEGLLAVLDCDWANHDSTIQVKVWTDTPLRAVETLAAIRQALGGAQIGDRLFTLDWRFLTGKGDVCSATTQERADEVLLDEAYPGLGIPVADFIAAYLSAPESVLVLQGPPGAGKTRLIRGILSQMSVRRRDSALVLYTGDAGIWDSDEVFVEFITGRHDAFVVEDADLLLAPRADGNQTLHRFLNIADGIARAHGRKIIFSTNLPNVRDIDSALTRPGRCFSHVALRDLNVVEMRRLVGSLTAGVGGHSDAVIGHLSQPGVKSWSVASVYAAVRRQMGRAEFRADAA